MSETRSKQFISSTVMLFSCAGLLVACADDQQKPAPLAMSAPPPTVDAGAPMMSGSPRISAPAPAA